MKPFLTNKIFVNRIILLYSVIFCLVFIIILRLFHIQIIKNYEYLSQSDQNRIKISLIPSPRGIIYDRNNIALTGNNYHYSIILGLENISKAKAKKTLKNLLDIAEVTPQRKLHIEKQIQKNSKNVTILKNITWEELVKIEINRYQLPGIYIQQDLSRIYKFPFSTSHILGYVTKPARKQKQRQDINYKLLHHPRFKMGATGIEKYLDDELRGEYGIKYEEVDAYSVPVRYLEEKSTSEVKGNDARITIDIKLQNLVYELMTKHNYSGSAVIMNINNGEILSMVSTPSFNSNEFVEGVSKKYWESIINNKDKPLLNKAINAQYPPGSTFKLMSALAILEKKINPKKHINCQGKHREGNQTFRCWKKSGHGRVNFYDAIKKSCNVYFFKTISKNNIEIANIVNVAKKFHYGKKINLKIGQSSSGHLPDKNWKEKLFSQPWFGGDTMNSIIGQGFILATPLQITLATAMIANGGKNITPKMISNNKTAKNYNAHISIKKEYLKSLRQGMYKVVNEKGGTAFNSKLTKVGFKMAGKTGTSQVISKREDEMTDEEAKYNKSHAIFTAFFPANAPKYAITTFIENGESGSKTAAPLVKEIIEKYQNWQ